MTIVGIVESDWPERPRRNIFYPPTLLKALGWPSEKDRRAAADARFLDLLDVARRADRRCRPSRSTTRRSCRDRSSSTRSRVRGCRRSRAAVDGRALFAGRSARRSSRSRSDRLHGERTRVGGVANRAIAGRRAGFPRRGARPAAARLVGQRDRDLSRLPVQVLRAACARLEEEPDDEEVMDPRRQGQFVHEVFEAFFAAWQAAGHRAITPGNLDAARELFTAVVDRALERLPMAEAGLERTRLLGSPAAAGLGEAVFRMEAERPIAVVERLLEHRLDGDFTIATADGPRTSRCAARPTARSARRRHVPADRLQAGMAAATRPRAAAADLQRLRRTGVGRAHGRPGSRRGGVPRLQGSEARRAAFQRGRARRRAGGSAARRQLRDGTVDRDGARCRARNAVAPKAGSDLRNQLNEQAGNLRNTATEGYRRATEVAGEWGEKGREIVDKAKDAAARGAEEAQRYAREATGKVERRPPAPRMPLTAPANWLPEPAGSTTRPRPAPAPPATRAVRAAAGSLSLVTEDAARSTANLLLAAAGLRGGVHGGHDAAAPTPREPGH